MVPSPGFSPPDAPTATECYRADPELITQALLLSDTPVRADHDAAPGVAVSRPEIYVSVDVETDGPIPGPHSMLSYGAAAFTRADGLIATCSANLHTLPEASGHPHTMQWWAGQPEAWAACRVDLRSPVEAMHELAVWLEGLPGKPIFVGYPASFDFLFVYWYLHRFVGRSPFSFAALDLKSVAFGLLGGEFRSISKARMPKGWFGATPHSHVALDDAIGQGELLLGMLRACDQRMQN